MTKYKETLIAYLVIGPFFLWYCIFSGIPLIAGFLLGFFEWNGLTALPKWIGFQNFITFFSSSSYLSSLWKQFWIGGLIVGMNTILSFFLALLLNIPMKLRGFFRSSFYIPSITAATATTAIVVAMLNPYGGGLNQILQSWGSQPIQWSYSTFWMVFWIVAYSLWRGLGPEAILWLAGLQSIDPTLYEAAKIDGANQRQLIRHITLPGLKPIATYIIITGFIGMMQIWDVVMLISRGGPVDATDVLMYRAYRDGLQSFNMGMAGTSSIVVGAIVLIFTVLYFKLILKGQDEN